MTFVYRFAAIKLALTLILPAAGDAAAQVSGGGQVIAQFQRAADQYAFTRRQIERRHAPAPILKEGALFEPLVAVAFRERIAAAARHGCDLPVSPNESEVPRVNAFAGGTSAPPACLVAALPKLPPELEYRMSGPVLLLADVRLQVVVDVLHAAYPARDN